MSSLKDGSDVEAHRILIVSVYFQPVGKRQPIQQFRVRNCPSSMEWNILGLPGWGQGALKKHQCTPKWLPLQFEPVFSLLWRGEKRPHSPGREIPQTEPSWPPSLSRTSAYSPPSDHPSCECFCPSFTLSSEVMQNRNKQP